MPFRRHERNQKHSSSPKKYPKTIKSVKSVTQKTVVLHKDKVYYCQVTKVLLQPRQCKITCYQSLPAGSCNCWSGAPWEQLSSHQGVLWRAQDK